MPYSCPQCRASFTTDETCHDRFNIGQLAEIEQPAKYAVHHLSVPCFMLQHNAYSQQGWVEVRELLAKFVNSGWTPNMARRHARISADSGHRTWSFTKGAKLSGVENIAWSYTVADVRLDTAALYCMDVQRWAESILADSEELIRSLDRATRP